MAIAEYQPWKQLLPTICISLVWGFLVVLSMLWNIVKKGPKRYFAKKRRDTRPEVLNDKSLGTHYYARMKNIRLHYVANGSEDKPLMLFLHGFPEFWYSWRHQLREFSKDYRVVALDMRGYSESERPQGIAQYHMEKLTADVRDFIDFIGYRKCILVAHDWGGAVAWMFSQRYPEMVERLIVCNMPHPLAFQKLLRSSTKQFKMSWYMFFFQLPWLPEIMMGSEDMNFLGQVFQQLLRKVPDKFTEDDLEAYKYTFKNCADITGPINYYRATLRYMPGTAHNGKVKCPTLIIFGEKDMALDKASVEPSKNYVDNECTIKFIPNVGHWVQQEAPDLVNQHIREYLTKA